MSLEFELPLVSFLFVLIISIVYFSKKKVDLPENKAYKIILICSIVEISIDLFIHVICSMNSFSVLQSTYYNLFNILNKILSMLFIIIFSSLFYYITLITYKNTKKVLIPLFIVNFISAIILIFTNITLVDKIVVTNVTGPTALYGYFMVALLLFASFFISIINIKKVDKRYISIFSILLLMGLLYSLTIVCPGIIIYDLVLALLCYIMYFTIENPDLKMVNELLRNRELVEEQMEDKSDFLFEMSQGIKAPTKNIIELTKAYDGLAKESDKREVVRMINVSANELIFKTNNILDVSSMDANKIKVVSEWYNPYKLFNQIKVLVQNKIKLGNIMLSIKLNNNIPIKLSGDDIKIKQIMMSVLTNAVNNTTKGYINVTVDSINRYDVCRLIIKVEDSGCGMSIDKINEILSSSKNLTEEDILKLENMDVDLPVVIKMIKLLGGNINIKSEIDKGTTINIVIDQKYELEEVNGVMKDIEKYSSDVYGRKRVLIVDDDKDEIFRIKSILNKYNVDINTTMMAKECVDRIKQGELYNLIIIDDELRTSSALAVLQELKQVDKFNVPVVIMLNSNKEHFKENYIDDGFDSFILKDNLNDELEKIISKNL